MATWLALLTKFFFLFHSAFHPFPTAEPAGGGGRGKWRREEGNGGVS